MYTTALETTIRFAGTVENVETAIRWVGARLGSATKFTFDAGRKTQRWYIENRLCRTAEWETRTFLWCLRNFNLAYYLAFYGGQEVRKLLKPEPAAEMTVEVAAIVAVDEVEPVEDKLTRFSSMTVAQLRDECDKVGIVWQNARGKNKHMYHMAMAEALSVTA